MVEDIKGRIPLSMVAEIAEANGLLLCVASDMTTLRREEQQRLAEWQRRGYAGEMEYMQRDPVERSSATFHEPKVKTVLSFATPYSNRAPSSEIRRGYGKVARYAWGKDYHRVLKKRLNKIGEVIGTHVDGEILWRPVTDSFPLLERAFARESGLGFIGKNTMLIRPRVGSYIFLAEVLTDIEVLLDYSPESIDSSQSCGTCSKCLSACPTDAFPEPFHLDARKCISYLTIEKRGALNEWESNAIGSWIFGCDICQEVCPFNHRAQKELVTIKVPEFRSEYGVGHEISLLEVLGLKNDEAFRERFQGTPLMRAKREGLIRNAIYVAVNQGYHEVRSSLAELSASDDSSLVRETATLALEALGKCLKIGS